MSTHKIPESVLVVIHTADLQVLLIERAEQPGFWQSVTGSKDSLTEPLAITAVREVLEETGIAVGSPRIQTTALSDWSHQIEYDIYPVWRGRYAPGIVRNTEHWFGLTVPPRVPIVLAPREHTAFVWLPYREAAARCFSTSNRDAILQLPARLSPARP